MRCATRDLTQLRDVANTLLLGPAVDETVDEAGKLLLRGEGEAGTRVLAVSFVRSPGRWVADWEESVGTLPEELVVVTTTDGFGTSGVAERDHGGGVRTEYVSSPGDLTGIGMAIGKYLERWYAEDAAIRVSFDSLTTILQYGEPQSVFRFLHLVTTRLDGADARAHFLLDPETQDSQTVATLESCFQAVARYRGDDEWEVNRR